MSVASLNPSILNSNVLEHDHPIISDSPDLISIIRGRNLGFAEKIAMIENGREVSYQEFWRLVDLYSDRLYEVGVRPAQPIGVICPMNSIEITAWIMALMQLKAVPFVLNLADPFQKLQPIDAELTGFIVSPHVVQHLTEETMREYVHVKSLEGEIRWYSRFDPAKKRLLPGSALLVTSSGSTNKKKIIRYAPKGLLNNIRANVEALGIQSNDRSLMVLPLTYSYGLVAQFMSHMYMSGTIIFANRRLVTNAIFELIDRYEVTSLFTVPPILRQLIFIINRFGHLYGKRYSWRTLRYVTVGGNHIEPYSVARALELLQCRIVKTYGLAEAGPRVASNCLDYAGAITDTADGGQFFSNIPEARPHALGSVGIALPGVEIEIIGDDGKPKTPGEVGWIKIKSPSIAQGYLYPIETNLKWGDGFLQTNDLGCLDNQGRLYIKGREGDQFVDAGGHSRWKHEIADLIYSRFPVLKLTLEGSLSGGLQINIVQMPGAKVNGTEVSVALQETFGSALANSVSLNFPRLSLMKIDK